MTGPVEPGEGLAALRAAVQRYQKAVADKDMLHLTGDNPARAHLAVVRAESVLDALLKGGDHG